MGPASYGDKNWTGHINCDSISHMIKNIVSYWTAYRQVRSFWEQKQSFCIGYRGCKN